MNQIASTPRWPDMSVAAKTSAITEMAQARLTAAKMAVALGATRNMILSHAHRKGITLARTAARVAKPRAGTSTAVSTHVAPIKLRVHPSVAASTWEPHREPVSLLELTSHACRWPVGEAGGSKQMFCGDRAGRRGYCERHLEMRVSDRPS